MIDLDGEIWKIIENFPDYEVSNQGRVKSLKFGKEIILTPGKNKGYLIVKLYKNGKKYNKTVHRLVLKAFKPNEDLNKNECNHIDGNKTNNCVENLEWCTHSENIKHAFRVGLKNHKGENHPLFGKHPSEEARKKQSEKMKGENNPNYGKHPSEESNRKQSEKMKGKFCGENNPRSTLTEKKVIEIWKDLNEGILSQKEIAEKFGVDPTTISNIKTGRTWNYLK